MWIRVRVLSYMMQRQIFGWWVQKLRKNVLPQSPGSTPHKIHMLDIKVPTNRIRYIIVLCYSFVPRTLGGQCRTYRLYTKSCSRVTFISVGIRP
jgi:hypothetical protein